MSNKSMLIGLVAGIGIAAAGGVAAYQFLGKRADDQGTAAVEQSSGTRTAHAPTAAQHSQSSSQHPTTVAAAAPAEDCWDEEVTTQRDKTDEHAIAGTALGAVVGGAIGSDVGDKKITTAAGAAAGAYIGRKIQQHIQENQAEKRTETHVEHHCAPAGTPH
jgi:uncharacterized protein YcfJ